MDLAKPLRAAQTRLRRADHEAATARRDLDLAAAGYDRARRERTNVDRARAAWGVALITWTHLLIAREQAKDAVALERRDTDRSADVALMMPKDPT